MEHDGSFKQQKKLETNPSRNRGSLQHSNSTPNNFANYPSEEFGEMASIAKLAQSAISPIFPVKKEAFRNATVTMPTRPKPTKEQEASIRKSLEEISREIQEISDFITVSENLLKEERDRDRELYIRERRRKAVQDDEKEKRRISLGSLLPRKEAVRQSPSPLRKRSQTSPNLKIQAYKMRKSRPSTPIFTKSKLYFRNGRIGCAEAEKFVSNTASTLEIVKQILKNEHERPLVSPESVQKVLNESKANHLEEFDFSFEPKKLAATLPCGEIIEMKEIGLHPPSDPMKEICLTYSEQPDVLNNEKPIIRPQSISSTSFNEKNTNVSVELSCHDLMPRPPKSLSFEIEEPVREQVHHLVRRFTLRARKMRKRLDLPPTPSSTASSPPPPQSQTPKVYGSKKLEKTPSAIIQVQPQTGNFESESLRSGNELKMSCPLFCGCGRDSDILDPQGKIYISWLAVVCLFFSYNAWVIPLRSTFPFQTTDNTMIWFTLDIVADIVYAIDILWFKHRVIYLDEGFWIKDIKLTRRNYMRSLQFKLDVISLLPLDLLYLKLGMKAVYLRFPRLLKIQTFWEVFKLLDRAVKSPHFLRIGKTLTYMMYMIHITACSYYAYSLYQGIGVNRWVYSGIGHPYVRCFAFAVKTATSIGKNPKPERTGELIFMTVAWLTGVFIFALLIGQIRDIISTATRSQTEYRKLEDETFEYMRRLNLPIETQKRVKMWFKFTWDQQRTVDESHILDTLPSNLKTDIAISVHIQTLSKVQLFADCEEALLRDLVLKLRAVTFLAGDYVCRKGEVGKEMYIVKLGHVQVMGGTNNDEVLATLGEGSVFGEISLLAINGAEGNRRTADVKSKGFANLFVLSKSDLNEALVYYPNAQVILKRRARSLMRKNAAREKEDARKALVKEADVVIGNPTSPETLPKLLTTVIQALPQQSPAVILLTRGSKKLKRKKTPQKDDQENEIQILHDDQNDDCIKNFDGIPLKNETSKNLIPKTNDFAITIDDEIEFEKPIEKCKNLTDSEKVLMARSESYIEKCDVIVHSSM